MPKWSIHYAKNNVAYTEGLPSGLVRRVLDGRNRATAVRKKCARQGNIVYLVV